MSWVACGTRRPGSAGLISPLGLPMQGAYYGRDPAA